MIERLVLFGATGDLAGRYLLPALAALHSAGRLPGGFEVIGAATRDLDDDAFRRLAAARLEEHASDVEKPSRDAVVRAARYRPVDMGDPASVAASLGGAEDPVAAYLALPPTLFPSAVTTLGPLAPSGSRIVLEKPFGQDLESATELNRLLADTMDRAESVYRVDHVLGMATTQNLMAMREANDFLDAFWNGAHVEQVDVLWEETLALEGRAGYYDSAGALRDVVQNHMLQLLALVGMEPHGDGDVHDRKLDILRSLRVRESRRARYTAGALASGVEVPAYADEDGVDPERGTETFVEITLEAEAERWQGTRFVLRAGKALSDIRKMVVVRFRRSVPPAPEFRLGIDGPEEITLQLAGPDGQSREPLILGGPPPASALPAYSMVLLDVLEGGNALSVSGEEAEEAWRVVTPVLEGWHEGRVPLQEYRAGSEGPPSEARSTA
jgi:glucose-6-phosphate 1-dehydrogenase